MKLDEMKAMTGAIGRILKWSPYYTYRYRDETALQAFEEWTRSLESFTCPDKLAEIKHSEACNNRHCLKIHCRFHETNSERSLLVYSFDFDVVRDKKTGKLLEVAILENRRI